MDILNELKNKYEFLRDPAIGDAIKEIERLHSENNTLLIELNKFTETSLQSTKMIKDLVSDLKTETELRIRLEKICERQHGILVKNGIFPAKEIKQ